MSKKVKLGSLPVRRIYTVTSTSFKCVTNLKKRLKWSAPENSSSKKLILASLFLLRSNKTRITSDKTQRTNWSSGRRIKLRNFLLSMILRRRGLRRKTWLRYSKAL